MCGVYGITWVDESYIQNMISRCKHRGPNNESIYTDKKNVTLGHNLLAITEKVEDSIQPWHTPKGNILVYNGEIFNYDDICKKYQKEFFPKSNCDTELLAWGLDKFGINFVEEIDSQHAFAYWDSHNLTITLSRDHVGIKPLFYRFADAKGIEFASELKAILRGGETVNAMAEACFAYTGLNVTEFSFFDGIYKVLPGESITFRGPNIVSKRVDNVIGSEDQKFCAEEFVEEVRIAVYNSMRGIKERGIFLSGGMDSAVLCFHASEVQKGIKTFTSKVHPNPKGGEDFNSDSYYAGKLARELGTTHIEILHKQSDWENLFNSAWRICEEPTYNWSIPMYQQVNKVISENNVVITLAGDMGDELTLGYPSYFKFQKRIFSRKAFQPKFLYTLKSWVNRMKKPPRIKTKISKDSIIEYLYNGPFKNLQNDYAIAAYQRMDQIGVCSEEFFRRNDRLGMFYSMEGRFPWASKRLMTYCMNINPLEKIKLGQKGMTKIAYKKLLPNYIINKEKTGWTSPIQQWRVISKDQPAIEMYLQWKKYGIL